MNPAVARPVCGGANALSRAAHLCYVRQKMNRVAFDKVKMAFSARCCPAKLLRSGLVGVDKLDADDLLTGLEEGKSIIEFFHSSIPYFAFLADDAAIFHLPSFLQIIAEERSELVIVLNSLDTDFGHRVLSKLTEGERSAVLELIEALKAEEGHEMMRKMLDEFATLVKRPNQALEPMRSARRSS